MRSTHACLLMHKTSSKCSHSPWACEYSIFALARASEPKDDKNSMRRRFAACWPPQSRSGAFPTRSETVQDHSWAALGVDLVALGSAQAVPATPWSCPDSWRGPGRVRMRLGDAPERPRSPKTAQDRFWIDFSLIFERFFLDFRSSGLR